MSFFYDIYSIRLLHCKLDDFIANQYFNKSFADVFCRSCVEFIVEDGWGLVVVGGAFTFGNVVDLMTFCIFLWSDDFPVDERAFYKFSGRRYFIESP